MPPKNWTEVQSQIHDLYIGQHQTLLRVKELMLRTHGFDASIRAYRDKLKEWGYLRRELRQQDVQSQLPSSGATVGHPEAALPSIQEMGGVFGGLPDFNMFPNSIPPPSESQGLWPNPSLHGSIPMNSLGQGNASFTPMSNTGGSAYAFPSGSNDANLNTRDSTGRTLLHQAVISRSLEDVEKYLSMGLAVDAQDDDSNQPLHLAAKGGSRELVRLLLKHKADPNAKGKSGRTPLHMSVRYPKAMKEILRACPEISIQDDNGDTPLHLVLALPTLSQRPKGSDIERLILAGANINELNADQTTPFHMMLEKIDSRGKFHTDYVVMFLENNANIFLRTKEGETPFKVFLEKIENRWYNTHPYMPSSKWNRPVKMFIAMKANTDITLKSGKTLLDEALYRGTSNLQPDAELVQLLCDSGEVNRSDAEGNCPLHYMAQCAWYRDQEKTLKWTRILLLRGADPNSANEDGQTPLIQLFAVEGVKLTEQVTAFTNFLLESGADPMMRDLKGYLPIYYVAKSSPRNVGTQVMKTLLRASTQIEFTAQRPRSQNVVPEDQAWWDEYHRFSSQYKWSDPTRLKELSHLLPNEVADIISSTALKMLATKFFQSLKSDFDELKKERGLQFGATKTVSYHIRVLLRDCLKLEIEVEQSWYQSLLDHFD